MSSLKRKASEIETTTNQTYKKSKKYDKLIKFCVKTNVDHNELINILKRYANFKNMHVYFDDNEWNSYYDKIVDNAFCSFLTFVPNFPKEEFLKKFLKLNPNKPNFHKWISHIQLVQEIIFDMNILQAQYSEFFIPYEILFKLYVSAFNFTDVHNYVKRNYKN